MRIRVTLRRAVQLSRGDNADERAHTNERAYTRDERGKDV